MKSGDFIDGVRLAARRYGMDLSQPLALVSGGPDSVAMLRVVLELGGEPVVLHADHGLRGDESREDAEFVRELCAQLGVDCEVRRLRLGGANLQEAAREERYRLAEEVADARGISTVITGHTADDVAETVLLNLARGAGLRGLAGIPPVRGRVARPLIPHRRADILEYLGLLGQPYRTDETNLRPKYARNRVRLEVLPILEDLYPGAGGNIARAASLLREDLETLESLAERTIQRRGEEVVVSLQGSFENPPALWRHAVRRAYATLAPDAPALGSVAVESILKLVDESEGTAVVDLPGGMVAAVRSGVEISLYRRMAVDSGVEELRVGEWRFGEWRFGGWGIEVALVREFDARDAARPEVAYLDAGLGPYRVRMAREGDRMRPLGLGGSKNVLKAMKDRKVPADLRSRTPVVVGEEGRVAWIFLGELDEAYKVTAKTQRMLRLEVRRIR